MDTAKLLCRFQVFCLVLHIEPQTSDIKSASGRIRRGEHARVCGFNS